MPSGFPVTIVEAGKAPPFVQVEDHAAVATVVDDGSGVPISLVDADAPPIVLVNPDGSPYEPAE